MIGQQHAGVGINSLYCGLGVASSLLNAWSLVVVSLLLLKSTTIIGLGEIVRISISCSLARIQSDYVITFVDM